MSKTKTPKKNDTSKVIDVTDDEPVITTRGEMQDWFDRWAEQLGMRLPDVFGNRLPELWGTSREIGGVMKIEEVTDENGMTIRGEIPGIDPDKDVEITVDNGQITIKAERRHKETTTENGQTRSEFQYGSYRRTCTLPAGASTGDIKATYEDGILEIHVPVDEARSDASKIPVTKKK